MPDPSQPGEPKELAPTGEIKVETLGRYRILGELGRGGCGVVYRALDPSIGRMVAIKTILSKSDSSSGQETRQRFRREARSAGNLSHPNIVTVHDFSDSGDPMFIAMEFVEGRTLAELMSSGSLELDFILDVMRSAADALDYAHAHHIVHRDVKPANFLIETGGRLKITDFGIAKLLDSEEGLTSTGMLVGTAQYMSPEQVSEAPVTGRSDQFSLAVIAYEMFTGIRPFQGNSWASVIHAIVMADPPQISKYRDTFGPRVDAVLRKALSKDPAARYASCTGFCQALEQAIPGSAIEHTLVFSRPPKTQSQPAPVALEAPAPSTSHIQPSVSVVREVPPQEPGKSPLKPLLVGAIGGIVIAAGLWFGLRSKPSASVERVTAQPSRQIAQEAKPGLPSPSAPAAQPTVIPPVTVTPAPRAAKTSANRPPEQPAARPKEVASTRPAVGTAPPKVTPPPVVQSAPPTPTPVVVPVQKPVAPIPTPSPAPVKLPDDQAKKASDEQAKRAADEQSRRLADEQTKRAAADQAARLAGEQAKNARATEMAAISRALRDYQAAYERKDLSALQAIWPSIPKQSLEGIRGSFREASEISIDLRPEGEPKINGATATVICARNLHQIVLKRTLQASGRVRIVLNRTSAGWVIQSVEPINQ